MKEQTGQIFDRWALAIGKKLGEGGGMVDFRECVVFRVIVIAVVIGVGLMLYIA